jgi:ABC-type nitrate/sulfonate/bicarbonate transport system ATPase subunit
MSNFVAIKDVELVYGRKIRFQALKDLDLEIERGEFAAVVGRSGCGKSSLM